MSLNKIRQVKADRGFKIWDLIIYAAVLILAAAVFLAVFLTRDNSPITGVSVYVGNTLVYAYDFSEGEIMRLDEYAEVVAEDKGKLTVRISAKGGYNDILIEKSGKVRVTDADCRKGDCLYSPPLTDNNGVIYCSPHGVKIMPFDYDIDSGKITI